MVWVRICPDGHSTYRVSQRSSEQPKRCSQQQGGSGTLQQIFVVYRPNKSACLQHPFLPVLAWSPIGMADWKVTSPFTWGCCVCREWTTWGGQETCLDAYGTDCSLMAAPLTDLCSGESQKEERICGMSRKKVSFFFSALSLTKEPCPFTVPLSNVLLTLIAHVIPYICSYSSPQHLSSKVTEPGSGVSLTTFIMVWGWSYVL